MSSNPLRWVGALLFTVIVPGTVAVALPYIILGPSFRLDPTGWSAAQSFALLLLLVGVGIYLRCLWDFVVTGRGIPSPVDHPKQLVVCGLYRYVRNPMYLGVLCVLLGEVAYFRSLTLLGYTALWLLVVHIVILVYEEPYLRSRFGTSYERYFEQVHRWIPGPPNRRLE